MFCLAVTSKRHDYTRLVEDAADFVFMWDTIWIRSSFSASLDICMYLAKEGRSLHSCDIVLYIVLLYEMISTMSDIASRSTTMSHSGGKTNVSRFSTDSIRRRYAWDDTLLSPKRPSFEESEGSTYATPLRART
jgi:hypothetical protein